MSEFSRNKRHKARKILLQALYQWDISGTEVVELDRQFREHNDMEKIDGDYFSELLSGITKNTAELDAMFAPFLDREQSALQPVELTILRIGCYELQHKLEIPYRVIIDEALRLGRAFGNDSGYKYVNAILDKVAKQVRSSEIKD